MRNAAIEILREAEKIKILIRIPPERYEEKLKKDSKHHDPFSYDYFKTWHKDPRDKNIPCFETWYEDPKDENEFYFKDYEDAEFKYKGYRGKKFYLMDINSCLTKAEISEIITQEITNESKRDTIYQHNLRSYAEFWRQMIDIFYIVDSYVQDYSYTRNPKGRFEGMEYKNYRNTTDFIVDMIDKIRTLENEAVEKMDPEKRDWEMPPGFDRLLYDELHITNGAYLDIRFCFRLAVYLSVFDSWFKVQYNRQHKIQAEYDEKKDEIIVNVDAEQEQNTAKTSMKPNRNEIVKQKQRTINSYRLTSEDQKTFINYCITGNIDYHNKLVIMGNLKEALGDRGNWKLGSNKQRFHALNFSRIAETFFYKTHPDTAQKYLLKAIGNLFNVQEQKDIMSNVRRKSEIQSNFPR